MSWLRAGAALTLLLAAACGSARVAEVAPPAPTTPSPPCSLPLLDADLRLGNANWTKGLQARSDWTWSGQLNPEPFPNHLARFFLQVPGVMEEQLDFSTALIFDEPSFRNGRQISGFLGRVERELVISYIGHLRRARYTATHHAVLGRLTCDKHGVPQDVYADKLVHLLDFEGHPASYSRLETDLLAFARAFATDPKAYTDAQYAELRAALRADNERQQPATRGWLVRLEAARAAQASALADGAGPAAADEAARRAAESADVRLSPADNEDLVDAQVVELSFLCLQFVALTDVFSGLNVPDEDFLPGVMDQLVPAAARQQIEAVLARPDAALPSFVPPAVTPPLEAILAGRVVVEPARPLGARVPLTPYEGRDDEGNLRPAFACLADGDKGLTIGGIQVGTYGWGFGAHYPGSLVYALMHHPELARHEAPYSLPLLFDEDEWRSGTQTAGFVTRRLKELVIQKIYKLTRSRYGIEHHTMFLYNTYLDEYGVGRSPRPDLDESRQAAARAAALSRAEAATLNIHRHREAPRGTYSELELAALDWTERLVTRPHSAHELEPRLRETLARDDRREVAAGLRPFDRAPDLTEDQALSRLVDHQLAELAMLAGHMDGLGRALTILRLEAEGPVQAVEGRFSAAGGILPDLDADGQVRFTGYFNNRPGLHDVLRYIGLGDAVLTLNELMANPALCAEVQARLARGEQEVRVGAGEAGATAEF